MLSGIKEEKNYSYIYNEVKRSLNGKSRKIHVNQ